MNVLKQWSNKNICNVIFDSKVDGDGSNNVLRDKVLNKCNVYFITFDTHGNIFGGYINVKIHGNGWIYDDNAFVFSLIRNKEVKNTKYSIKSDYSYLAFQFPKHSQEDWLYQFGNRDVYVRPIDDGSSYCNDGYYYNNNGYFNRGDSCKNYGVCVPLTGHIIFIDRYKSRVDTLNFQAKRIVVI